MIMKFTETSSLLPQQKMDILRLWNDEYPQALGLDNVEAFDQYLETLSKPSHILLENEDGIVHGWLVYFIRDDEQCFAMLLNPSLQGKGWGSKFLALAKERTVELHGWVSDSNLEIKRNGEKYLSPVGFYVKNGFEVRPAIRVMKKNINGIRVSWRSPAT